MHDATTVATPLTQSQAGRIGSGGASGSASGAVKTQLKQKDFAAGAAMLAPRAPVQAKAIQRSEAPADDECVDAPGPVKPVAERALHDIGEVASFPAALRTLGNTIDPYVLDVGASVEFQAKGAVSANAVYSSLGFNGGLTRTEHGLEGNITLTCALGIGVHAGTTEEYGAFEVSQALEVKGDTVGECADLVGLWFYEHLSSQPDSIWDYVLDPAGATQRLGGTSKYTAEALWGKNFPAHVLANMDAGNVGDEGVDSVSQVRGAGLDLSMHEAESGTGGNFEVGGGQRETLTKGDDGELTKTTSYDAGFNLTINVLGCSGSISGSREDGWSISLDVPVPAQVRGMGTVVMALFGNVLNYAFNRLVMGKTVEPLDVQLVLGALRNWHAALVGGIDQKLNSMGLDAFSGSLGFAGGGTFDRPPKFSLTVTNATNIELDKIGGAAEAGGRITASASAKSVLISVP